MRKIIAVLMASMLAMTILPALSEDGGLLSSLVDERTTWRFSDEAVDENDLKSILAAGVNADSAMNEQPWTFHVITDVDLITELSGSAKAPVMIIVAASQDNQMKLFDAGLAAQSMQIAARALGYGSKIETLPARMIRSDQSGEWNSRLGIPEGEIAVAALFIGHKAEEADALSSASERYDFDVIVKYVN